MTSFSYPGCMRPGSPVLPLGSTPVDGVAIVGAPVSVGGSSTTPGAHVVTNQAGTIGWSSLAITRAATSAQEFTWAGVTGTTFPAWPIASTVAGRREPDVVRLAVTGETLLAYVSTTGQVRLAGLPPASISWSANVAATNASGGAAITSTRAPSLVEVNGLIFMATTSGANLIQIWRLGGASATPIQNRTWMLQAFPVSQTSGTRPTLSAMLNRDDFTGDTWRLGVTYTDTANNLWWWVTAPAETGATFSFSVPGGAVAQLWGGIGGGATPVAPAMVWDSRSYVGTNRDLRVLREIGTTTSSRLRFAPFGRGPAPGRYTDYNDWFTVRWGLCASLELRNSVSPVQRNCGPQPVYPEPLAGGGMGLIIEPAWNDASLYPHLYTPRPAVE